MKDNSVKIAIFFSLGFIIGMLFLTFIIVFNMDEVLEKNGLMHESDCEKDTVQKNSLDLNHSQPTELVQKNRLYLNHSQPTELGLFCGSNYTIKINETFMGCVLK